MLLPAPFSPAIAICSPGMIRREGMRSIPFCLSYPNSTATKLICAGCSGTVGTAEGESVTLGRTASTACT